MGNCVCRLGWRGGVDERLTRPQRVTWQPSNVDYKKLRRLILSKKLAPCFDAIDDPNLDLEECPICFFYYPSLNRSRCCGKGICTDEAVECHAACATSYYAVEFRGARSREEKELELAEEQKVIQAKLRMQSETSQDSPQAASINAVWTMSGAESPRPIPEEQSTDSENSMRILKEKW
ncbi:E3 ubiquitin-protein ligase GW2-like isoform X3 [Wolffia australiana]